MICFTMVIPPVSAEYNEDGMGIEWYGDYSDMNNPKLVVEFQSPALYRQQVSAIIYDPEIVAPAATNEPEESYERIVTEFGNNFYNLVRMQEITVIGQEKKAFSYVIKGKFDKNSDTFDVTAAYDPEERHFKLKLQGSGYMSGECIEIADIYAISAADASGILSVCSSDSNDTLKKALIIAKEPLQLDSYDSTSEDITSLLDMMKNIKAVDYDGRYQNLNIVRDAWNITDALNTINTTSSSTIVKSILTENRDLLDIDTFNQTIQNDFDNNISLVSSKLESKGKAVVGEDTITTIRSKQDLVNSIGNYVGVQRINEDSHKEDENKNPVLISTFNTYKDYLNLDPDMLSAYNNMDLAQQAQVMAYVRDEKPSNYVGYASYLPIKAAFDSEVQSILNSSSGDGSGSGNDGSGSGNDGGGGGATPPKNPSGNETGSTPTDEEPTQTTDPTDAPTPEDPTGGTVSGFDDVSEDNWAFEFINELAKSGVINGYDDGTYRPNNFVTREEFVKIIISACGLYDVDATGEFSDMTKDSWFYQFVVSAVARGIISGMDDGSFGVGLNITRQDVAVIVARTIESLLGAQTPSGESTLTDIDSVSDYAKDAVMLLNELGIITGYDDGSYMPFGSLTRAEAAAILSKLMDVI